MTRPNRKRSSSGFNKPPYNKHKSGDATTNSVQPSAREISPIDNSNIDNRRRNTTMHLSNSLDSIKPEYPTTGFSQIGGYESQCLEVCRLCMHLKHPEIYSRLGITPPRGVLLHGPPGCGKTTFARAIAGELKLPIICISSTELVTGISGGSEQKIRQLFSRATELAPAIVLLDDIDAIGSKRENAQREMERRIVIQLIASLDDLGQGQSNNSSNNSRESEMNTEPDKQRHILVIGTTNRLESLDASLRRAGRFDNEIALGIPNQPTRVKILSIATKNINMATDINLSEISRLTPGYVGADLFALVREASLSAINRIFNQIAKLENSPINSEVEHASTIPEYHRRNQTAEQIAADLKQVLLFMNSTLISDNLSINTDLRIKMSDFHKALSIVQPSAKREGFVTVPDVTWDEIGALKKVRSELEWCILHPIKRPEDFELFGAVPKAQGILLCGPPGVGKTLLAKAIANETGMSFISVKGPELLSMYVGESERAVRTVFQRARDSSPCVIFFDEIDALCPRRSQKETSGSARLVNQLLTEMDGLEERKQVFLIAATNRPDIVDPAILRPGRLDKVLYVDFPTAKDRAEILRKATKNGKSPRISPSVSFEKIAENSLLDSFTGADLVALVHEASIIALRQRIEDQNESIDCITMEHFEKAMKRVMPSVNAIDKARYMELKKTFALF